jgi:hypothetical protein
VPIAALAPERFSTTKVVPSDSVSFWAIARDSRSTPPPAGTGATMVTGREGQWAGCDHDAPESAIAANATAARAKCKDLFGMPIS